MNARLPTYTEAGQTAITRQWADVEWSEHCAWIRNQVPTHEQLAKLLEAVHSAALSFHEHAGFEHSEQAADDIEAAMKSHEYSFYREGA